MFRKFFKQLFPFPTFKDADSYAKSQANLPGTKEILEALEKEVQAQNNEKILEEFHNHALSKKDGERERQTSIITRAQGLLVGLAIFGVLFPVAANIASQNDSHGRFLFIVYALIALYIAVQMIAMVSNVLKAISGLKYFESGSSDLTKWMASKDLQSFYKSRGLFTLEIYRNAVRMNDWRFEHLNRATHCLRNIVWALGGLIVLIFGILAIYPPPAKDPLFLIFS